MALLLWIMLREKVENGVLVNRSGVRCGSDDKRVGLCLATCAAFVDIGEEVCGCGGIPMVLRQSVVSGVIEGCEDMSS